MKIPWIAVALMMLMAVAAGATREVSGVVTYRTSGSVYTSLGTDAGIQDSTILYVISNRDTVASLRVVAVSSKSSVCQVVESVGTIEIGDKVVGTGLFDDPIKTTIPAPLTGLSASSEPPARVSKENTHVGPLSVKGRMSTQFYSMQNEQSSSGVSQPGFVINTTIMSNEVPISAELYANFRNLYYGDGSPFSGRSVNNSRIYRVSVGYDNGTTRVMIGRFAPTFAPSIGYIDGTLLSTSVNRFAFGLAAGFQPSYSQRGMSTDYKKIVLFTSYMADTRALNQITLAYARTYFQSDLDREAVSFNGRMTLSSSLFLSTNADIDLRKRSGDEFLFSPQISQIFVNASYRVLPALGLGVGANATRPLYSYSLLKSLPEGVLDTDLRGGLSLSLSVYLPASITVTNTYTPRTSTTGFADNYTEYVALTFANIGYSGVTLRTNFNMGETEYTRNHGYGVHLFKNWWSLLDTTLRYQQSTYSVKRYETAGQTTTMAADLMIPIGRTFAIVGTWEHLESTGLSTNTLFTEFTVRF